MESRLGRAVHAALYCCVSFEPHPSFRMTNDYTLRLPAHPTPRLIRYSVSVVAATSVKRTLHF
ncbi:hypothetical protein [Paraburkholderia domus]|jgi:hypothetical protein|uniref:hypothetical protein n=1 Tax=Paraburkholderia domus TaxID=2793075 RepID=UPI0019124458|nr:hypothetical protein [Paraburkholderia domus]MBK5051093.1 hypothetical protein [Burkholderia sp. R-70006]MBK5065033.1 hypothetical protein [Burkholderia sp. R-70199]MBK5091020.1 hypothetical protein [Burkholderia sp. R-69927]MBK5118671.1 hypothetical protein [Burkholderia sp. R-69980]MBK5164509.1 hypothetical protein [Burkholderia sp. R-70211]MBK5181796.1 hypothetical protein [Burkholderia sp. R-69749]MCI0144691.1 hypothetical protein [Paraburkholderia sediminicola]